MAKQTLLQIPTPCSQNWEEMSVVPGGRFCDSCEKKVIDFSLMSDRQILGILSKSKGEVCGRFVNEQLNRELAVSSQQSNALIPAVLISTALMAGTAMSVHATERKLPDMEQDTTKPVALIPPDTTECDILPGYPALSSDLVVVGYGVTKKTFITGAIAIRSEVIQNLAPKKKRRFNFWR
ncbi:hypothetical protein SAMN05428988_1897 [Chitinophaga sp. YR573]|uniref:hypothetical protein n=1 Tax=Chitinophaga sp. YR573 TaxID=1881040 RepID=UPI0008CBFB4D|nr:hypothetical protein [Chitinophaga sp. YR573]SEW08477.1 hypothetical protein SAMN05428988_1897 [Chitinophaga sp. YR573]